MIATLKRIYQHSVESRLSKIHGMELHKEDFDVFSDKISFYYADFSKCILNKENALDEKGVFYLKGDDSTKIEHNVCAVAEFAIIEYENYLRTKLEKHKTNVRNQINWLVENAVIKDNKLYWYYLYDDDEHKAPWASGISQGIGISALVRGAELLNEDLLDLAEFAANSMIATVDEEGFRYGKGSYEYWYEESCTNSHILNGHIYSILGFYDLYRLTKNETYKSYFDRGVKSIKENIKDFDLRVISKYDSHSKFPANNSYHHIHCVLFEVLYRLTKDEFFLFYKDKWLKIYESNILKGLLTIRIALMLLK
jgi:heparosan-N-sulfate-glucuronate 5-epimerase